MGARAQGSRLPATFLLRPPPSRPSGPFFLVEGIPAHAITVRQVLFDGAPIPGKFTFNDRPPTGVT